MDILSASAVARFPPLAPGTGPRAGRLRWQTGDLAEAEMVGMLGECVLACGSGEVCAPHLPRLCHRRSPGQGAGLIVLPTLNTWKSE